ncbi:MAG: hypothetical protein AAB229_06570 [Candidatus Hydrogenedentota bacterium]
MRWYLYRNDTVHGPYEKEELKTFLAPADKIARENTDAWTDASGDELLEDIFTTFLQPVLEWHVTPKGRPQRGPFAQSALLNLLKKKEIAPDDLLKHESWPKAVPLRDTRIYRYLKDDLVKLEDVPPDEWKEAPRQKNTTAPVPPSGRKRRIKLDFELTTGRKIMIGLVVMTPLIGFIGYDNFYRGSDIAFRIEHGTATGNCTTDEISKTICPKNPGKCGCNPKGDCSMPACEMYRKMQQQGQAK